MSLAARVAGDPAAATATIRRLVQEVDPQQSVFAVRPFETIITDSLANRRVIMSLIMVFAAMALLLAAIGLYGVMAYQVEQRTREIGIRMALGARAGHVARMVVLDSARMAAVGIVLGIGAAVGLSRAMGSMLYGVTGLDPLTYGLTSVLLAGVVLVATYLPARRATRIDPMVALRR
jgi:ABC-type antimicrobial peptide transport system permease subunit